MTLAMGACSPVPGWTGPHPCVAGAATKGAQSVVSRAWLTALRMCWLSEASRPLWSGDRGQRRYCSLPVLPVLPTGGPAQTGPASALTPTLLVSLQGAWLDTLFLKYVLHLWYSRITISMRLFQYLPSVVMACNRGQGKGWRGEQAVGNLLRALPLGSQCQVFPAGSHGASGTL